MKLRMRLCNRLPTHLQPKIDLMNVVREESLFTSSSDSITFSELVHSDEKIREILCVDDLPWEDLHHRSSF
jgi:hypothetical protein